MMLQPFSAVFIVRNMTRNMLPIPWRMIVFEQVAKFMDDNAINNTMRCENDAPIVG